MYPQDGYTKVMANPSEINRHVPQNLIQSQRQEEADFISPGIYDEDPNDYDTEELPVDLFSGFEGNGDETFDNDVYEVNGHYSNGNGQRQKKGGHEGRHRSNACEDNYKPKARKASFERSSKMFGKGKGWRDKTLGNILRRTIENQEDYLRAVGRLDNPDSSLDQ